MAYLKRRPIAERVIAGVLSAAMVASGVPAAAWAEVGGGDAPDAGNTLSAAAAEKPSSVRMELKGSEVYSGTFVKVGDKLSAVTEASQGGDDDDYGGWDDDDGWDDDYYWSYSSLAAQSDEEGVTYQWYRGSKVAESAYGESSFVNSRGYQPISGATSAEYTVTKDDLGSYLAVCVSAEDGSWSVWPGNSTGQVVPANAAELGKATITGDAKSGATLQAVITGGTYYHQEDLPADAEVTYTWKASASKPASFGEKAGNEITNQSDDPSKLTLTPGLKGMWVWVVANAGMNTIESDAVGPIVAEGQTYLDGVHFQNAPSGDVELGTKLTAEAYTGNVWTSVTPVTENVTYTWRFTDSDPTKYGAHPSWTPIEGETGSTFTPNDENLVGKWISVTASAGANTAELPDSSAIGPLKEKGPTDQEKVEAAANKFSYDLVTPYNGSSAVNHDEVTEDFVCPRPRKLGIDGGSYPVSYTSDNTSVITFNGSHAQVVRPVDKDAVVNVTCTVTKRGDPTVTASKTLPFTVKALLAESDIDAELKLLDDTEAAYRDGSALLDGKTQPITSDLSTFQKAYRDDEGLAFARTYDEAVAHNGISAVEIDGYDDMGSAGQARLFKSSNPSVIANETLLLTQPAYNATVTVSSKLRSDRFGAYYEKYKDDASVSAELKAKLKRLAGEDVSCDLRVAGTTGQDDPNPKPGEPAQQIVHTTVNVLVQNDDGTTTSWLAGSSAVETKAGSTAADATKAVLAANGITYDDGLYTLTHDGQSLGYDEATGKFWNFYVNGTSSDKLASNTPATEGDTYTWIYRAYGNTPKVNDVEVHPEKVRPSGTQAEWPSFRDAATNTADLPTPTNAAKTTWTQQVTGGGIASPSDPILVGGKVFVAVGDRLQARNATTGALEREAKLAASIDSTCRMAYADGIIVVPLHGGRLQALTPDDLTTVWVSNKVGDGSQQSLSTLTVADGCVYFGTTNGLDKDAGSFCRVRLADGHTDWTYTSQGSSYYWGGAVVTSSGVVVAQNNGELDLMDAASGTVTKSLNLGAPVSSSVVASDSADGTSTTVYVACYDGTLHKVTVDGDTLADSGSVELGDYDYSVSTPALSGGKLYVGVGKRAATGLASAADAVTGALCVVDAETLEVDRIISTTSDGSPIPGPVSSSPLVVTRDGDAYVYFTANAQPGGVYVYKLGDATARVLFTPAADQQQYTTSSLVPDSTGSLYYVNDSGTLFKLVASDQSDQPTTPDEPTEPTTPTHDGGSDAHNQASDQDQKQETAAVYRLYNPWSGEHLFTLDAGERDSLASIGWSDEGVAWKAPKSGGKEVYRLYNPYSGDHHYTQDKGEYDSLQAIGWRGEGVSFRSSDGVGKPVYRLYNPWLTQGTHLFTVNLDENASLGNLGWQQEGIAFWGLS